MDRSTSRVMFILMLAPVSFIYVLGKTPFNFYHESMRVLQVVPYFYPAWSYGGIAKVCYHLSVSLAHLGLEVDVVTTDVLDEKNTRRDLSTDIEGVSVRAYRNLSNLLAYHLQLFLPLKLHQEEISISTYDIVHIHGHRNLLNTRLSFWANRAGIPVILEPGGTLVNKERRRGLKKLYDIIFGNRQIEATDFFIAVSNAEKEQFLGLNIPKEKIVVIPNGVVVESVDNNLSVKDRFGIKNDYILYLGRLSPSKGIEHLIHALSMIPDKALLLVIAGNDMGIKHTLKRLTHKLGLSDRVIFPGLIKSPWKEAAYREALVTVYAGQQEIFGLVPFESILCGTPAIVANDSGCGEWIEKSGGGYLVPYGDPTAIAEVIMKQEPAKDRERVRKAGEWIQKNMSWESVARQMVSVYEKLLSKRNDLT